MIEFREDDLRGTEVRELIREHLEEMAEHSPPESIHALDLDGLTSPNVTFWSAWQDDELLGCGALKELDARHGEIKSMRTVRSRLRTGVGRKILEYLIGEARRREYHRLSLETGSMDAFAAARNLYVRYGFGYCAPFADYAIDPNSVFMTLEL